jgi:hypothetical protein
MPPRRIGEQTPGRNFRIEDTLYDPAQTQAEREGRTLTWVVRWALQLYIHGELPMPGDGESPLPGGGDTGSGEQS